MNVPAPLPAGSKAREFRAEFDATFAAPPPPPAGSACWLVLAQNAAGAPCALACTAVEKLIFVPEAALTAPARAGAPVLAPWGTALVPVIDLPALLADILQRKQSPNTRSNPP